MYAVEEEQQEYYYHVSEREYGVFQVIAKSDKGYLIEYENDEWLYLQTNQPLYVGGWYVFIADDTVEYVVDIMRIEPFDDERIFEALMHYYEDEVGTFNENDFMYWLATNHPQLYRDYIVEYYNYVDEYWLD